MGVVPDGLGFMLNYRRNWLFIHPFMSLLGWEAVDREDDLAGRLVLPPQGLGVLLPCSEHHLIMMDVPRDRVLREMDTIVVSQFALDLGDRPVP